MNNKKYRLTEESIDYCGHMLHRIQALRDFGDVKADEFGGFVESEDNLSHEGNAWVFDQAKVFGNSFVYRDAEVFDNALVYGIARVSDQASVYDYAQVSGYAYIGGNAKIHGCAKIYSDVGICGDADICSDAVITKREDYIIFKNWWSSGRFFTWTRSNDKWKVGCFYGTDEELVKKAYKDSEVSGREYLRIVNYVREIQGKSPYYPLIINKKLNETQH